jgi:type II secretory pathway pseudopilin PulG
MDYAVTATMDWRNVRAWVETAAAVFAAVGTVLAFFAMRRTARAQEATLGVQASQLALQQEQIDNERNARVEAEHRSRRSTMMAAIQEIDRNVNILDEQALRPLETDYMRKAYHLVLDHGPINFSQSVREDLNAVEDYGSWALIHRTQAGQQVAYDQKTTVRASMDDARSILMNMEMSIGKPDAQPYHWD